MKKAGELDIRGTVARVVKINGEDFVCLTDMAKLKSKDAQQTISNWMRNRMTLEYLGLWEELYNPDFKPLGFKGFRLCCKAVACGNVRSLHPMTLRRGNAQAFTSYHVSDKAINFYSLHRNLAGRFLMASIRDRPPRSETGRGR